MLSKKEAFSSLEFLVTLFVLLILTVGFSFFITTSHRNIEKKTLRFTEKEEIDLVLENIYKKIKEDNTPESDSRFDPIWKINDTHMNGYYVSIKSLSGKINLNYINPNIILNSGFKNLFENNSISLFNDLLNEKLLNSYDDIQDFISKETFDKYFTFYGYGNINTIKEKALGEIVNKITKVNFGNEIINRRKILFQKKQYFQKETEFSMFCGIYYDDISPYINSYPQINVQFIEEDALRCLIDSPAFRMNNWNQKVNSLISLRNTQEITKEDISFILGISKNDELYYYLGCNTWAWQIDVVGKNTSCQVILYRAIDDSSIKKPKFYLIEKKWDYKTN